MTNFHYQKPAYYTFKEYIAKTKYIPQKNGTYPILGNFLDVAVRDCPDYEFLSHLLWVNF